MRIASAFFAEFHAIQGPRVVTEYPSGFFLPALGSPSSESIIAPGAPALDPDTPLLDFDAVSEFVISKRELCGKALEM